MPTIPHASVVIIRMSQLGMLDATGANTLAQIPPRTGGSRDHGDHQGGAPEHMNLLTNVGVFDSLRHENHLMDSLDEAIGHARTHVACQPH